MSINLSTSSPHSASDLVVAGSPSPSFPSPAVVRNPELTKAFLLELCGTASPGQLVLCTAPQGNDKNAPLTPRWFDATDLAGAAAFAARQDGHVWFAVGLQRERLHGGKRGGSQSVVAIFGVWSDIDVSHAVHKKTDLPPTLAAAMTLINRVSLTPTVVVDTGHGLQPYWLFHEPLVFTDDDHRQAVQELLNQFKATVAGYAAEKKWSVDAVADLARLMRLPGTLNLKEPDDPRPVLIYAHNPECRYTIEQIRAVLKVNQQSLLQVSPAEPAPALTDESNVVSGDAKDDQDEDRDLRDLSADCVLLAKARAARNGTIFDAIWGGSDQYHGGDTSKADMGLLMRLAFWTRKDAAQMDRMVRASGRWRPKWDEKHFANGDTYGEGSIKKALARTTKVYDPQSAAAAADDGDAGGEDGAAIVVMPIGPPIPLDAHKPPELPAGIFCGWLGDMIDGLARHTETPPELAAMNVLAVLGTVCQKRFSIRPEPGYFEPLNVWTICALVPGNRKSAVLQRLIRPLGDWERRNGARMAEERKRVESSRKTKEARIGELRTVAKKKSGPDYEALEREIAVLESELPEIPELPRLFTQDCTPEHLGTMLANHGERIAMLSDEGGFFDLVGGRYSNGLPNLDLVLQAHSGSPVRVDRGSRPSVNLHHPALTIGLAPQPGVLRGLTAHRGFRDRGLLARFLYALPASPLGHRTLRSCPIDDAVAAAYDSSIGALADVDPHVNELGNEVPRVLYLDEGAYRAWKDWSLEVEPMMSEGGRLEHLTDWGGKLPGATARIAGLLHLADYASCAAQVTQIDAGTMDRAIELARFLLEHAMVAFDMMGADPGLDAARRLWREIDRKRMKEFTARDAWHPCRGSIKRAADAEPGFQTLVDYNYIIETHSADFGKLGRPVSRTYRVNPTVVEGWR